MFSSRTLERDCCTVDDGGAVRLGFGQYRVGRRCLDEVEMLSVVRWRHGGGRRSTLQRRPGSPLVGFARNFGWGKRVPSSAAGEVKASVDL